MQPESPIRVPAQWPRKRPCKLAFIGEAPGQSEIDHRDTRTLKPKPMPLVGSSGIVFNQAMRTANLDRFDCLVTNLFDQKAPDNDVGPWMRDKEVYKKACDRLFKQIERANPAVLVPMGGAALKAVADLDTILDVRGAALTSSVLGRKVLPTVHPAFVMRSWKYFTTMVADFVKAAALADEPRDEAIRYSRRELWLEPTLDDLAHFKRAYLDKTDLISVDIETIRTARQITNLGFAADSVRAINVPFVDWRRPNRSYWPTLEDELAAWEFVRAICECDTPKLLQNGLYDAFWLFDRMGIKVMNYREDTRLLHHALYPELPKDLAYLGSNYARTWAWKSQHRRKKEEKRDA